MISNQRETFKHFFLSLLCMSGLFPKKGLKCFKYLVQKSTGNSLSIPSASQEGFFQGFPIAPDIYYLI